MLAAADNDRYTAVFPGIVLIYARETGVYSSFYWWKWTDSTIADESYIDEHGYPIANIKGDNETRRRYYETLEEASSGDNSAFVEFIEDVVIQSLTYYLKIIRG